jgi:cysteine desulfurase
MRYVYLDNAATTPVRAEVREAMAPYLDERFGNPSSIHRWGREARGALEQARERVAAALGAKRREIVFTGGGTEGDNIAVLGRWHAVQDTLASESDGAAAARRTVVCSAIEHKAILSAVKQCMREGAEMIVLGVDERGVVQLKEVEEALRSQPAVVSVMWANNEVGTVQPIAEIAALCQAAGVTFHTDAVQAFGKLRVRVDETPCDLLSISAHKVCGPKGTGALFIRGGLGIAPLTHGGGQERELRPGTENVASAVGFAVAAELAAAEQASEHARLLKLRDHLAAGIRASIPDCRINGEGAERLPNILNVSIAHADQEGLLIGLDLEGVAVSGASACQSGAMSPSHVLAAMGCVHDGDAAVRFSLGHTTTMDDIEHALQALPRVVARVRDEVHAEVHARA